MRLQLLLLILVGCRDTDGDGTRDKLDCALADPAVHIEAVEACNGADDDCDGFIDEGVTIVAHRDVDGDGFGDAALARRVCAMPDGGVADGSDCDDTSASINPEQTEICDSRDQDCDGQVDEDVTREWYVDADDDGHGGSAATEAGCLAPSGFVARPDDCDDADPAAWTDAPESCDALDNDCDGAIDEGLPGQRVFADDDGDGHGDADAPGVACGATPGWSANAADCDDTDAARGPHAAEIANDADDDCDGWVDETPLASLAEVDEALAAADPGAVLQLAAGTFAGTVDLAGFDVVFAGAGCGHTVVYGDGGGPVVSLDGGTLADLSVVGGRAERGGGLAIAGGATVERVCVEDNRADENGGGVAVSAGAAEIVDSEIVGNLAGGSGGGLDVAAGASVRIVRTRIVGNRAGNDGGGARSSGGFVAESTVIAANSTVDDGGGVWLSGDADVERRFTNVTFDANDSPSDGPALWSDRPVDLADVLVTRHASLRPPVHAAEATFGALGVWGNGGVDSTLGWLPEAVRGDPRFYRAELDVLASARDWRLAVGSPAIGAAALGRDLGAYPNEPATYATDSDDDGLPDGWEASHGTAVYEADSSADPDGDGLDNASELALAADPHRADSDDDGVPDGVEAEAGDSPALAADHAPTAVIVGPRLALLDGPLTLDGGASTDPDDDPLTFSWSIVDRPAGAVAELAIGGTSAELIPDRPGRWAIAVEVADGNTTRATEHAIDVFDAVIIPDDAPDLAAALAQTDPGGAIALRPGRYVGVTSLGGVDAIVFGLGAATEVILDAAGRGRVLDANDGESLTLAHLTLANGDADDGGGLRSGDGELTMVDVRVVDCHADDDGGGMIVLRSPVTFEDVVFLRNDAGDRGGGVRLIDTPFHVARATFANNRAGNAGGGLDLDNDVSAEQRLDAAAFVENEAPKGSALDRIGGGTATWASNLGFAGNSGVGSVIHASNGDLHLFDAVAARNIAASFVGRDESSTPARVTLLYPSIAATFPLFSHPDGVVVAAVGPPALGGVTLDGDPDDDVWAAPPGSAQVDAGHPEHADPDGSRADIGPWGGPYAVRFAAPFSRDRDGDGMSDGWEAMYGLDPDRADGDADPDEDGIDNHAESVLGTDPLDDDSDSDGLSDRSDDDPTDPRGHRPRADAGDDVAVHVGVAAVLDGSGSTDPEREVLTWRWAVLSAPPGSAITTDDLVGPTTATPRFVPDVRGTYRIGLVASDPYGPSEPDVVEVHAWDELAVPGDYATFAEAIADSVDHDTIVLGSGVHRGAATLTDGRTLVIKGAGAALTVVEGPGDRPVFDVSEGASIIVADLTVRRGVGDEGGLIACESAGVTADRVRLEAGVAYNGGALGLDGCEASLTDVDVVGNGAAVQGSGVWAGRSTLDWTRGTVEANGGGTDLGGGVYLVDSTTRLRNLIIRGNTSEASGSAVYATGGTLDAAFLTLIDNTGPFGAITVYNTVTSVRHTAIIGSSTRGLWRNGTAVLSTARNAYFANSGGATFPGSLVSPTDVLVDPRLISDTDPRLSHASPLIDAGDPAVRDPDGTIADIGAFGGPDAPRGFDGGYVDADSDGLPDRWEVAYGLTVGPDDAASDADGDTLSAATELAEGTAPDDADSDGDGVRDPVEVAAGDPVDPADHAPRAVAGRDQLVDRGATVALDGSGASDPDGGPVAHRWRFVSTPATSARAGTTLVGVAPTFVADRAGTYVIVDEVTAPDGGVGTDAVQVVVRGDVAVPADYPDVAAAITAVAPGSAVVIGAGTWPCRVDLDGRDVALVGAGAGLTVLDGEDRGSVIAGVAGEAISLRRLSVASGRSPRGGAVRSDGGGFVTLSDVVLRDNDGVYGAAVYLDAGDLVLTDTSIVDGYAVSKGGGIWATDASVDGVRVRLAGLATHGSGGAIYANRTDVTLHNALFADDRAFTGAGIHLTGAGSSRSTASLYQVTAVFDRAVSTGGLVYAFGSDVVISSSIVAWTSGYIVSLQSGATLTADHSVVFENEPSDWYPPPGPGPAETVFTADPAFVDATDDGDWTNDDLRLTDESPAIDAGDPAFEDPDGSRADAGYFGGPAL